MAGASNGAKALARVTSFNVLAQCYVRSTIFPHSPKFALKCVRASVRPRVVP